MNISPSRRVDIRSCRFEQNIEQRLRDVIEHLLKIIGDDTLTADVLDTIAVDSYPDTIQGGRDA